MTRVKFAALLVALVIGCTSLGSAASYYLNFFWYAAAEPIVYPCPYPGNASVCSQNLNQPDPDLTVWRYAGHPSTLPIFTSSRKEAAYSISSTMTRCPREL